MTLGERGQKNVASKLQSIDIRLSEMNEQMTQLNENFSRLADNTETLVDEIKTGFKDIAGRIDVNNVLVGINAYQSYRINKNIQRQNQ
jgi:predicted transcriptional regulator